MSENLQFELNAELRTDKGKGASRRLRRLDKVPAIMYGLHQEPTMLTLLHNELERNLQYEAFFSHILTIKYGNQSEQAVLKDLQRHPSKPRITHVDLQRVSSTEKLYKVVPIHFTNEDKCAGVKIGGGVISHQTTEVEVLCYPQDLPEFIEVDTTNLQLGENVHLSNLKLPKGVEIPQLSQGEEYDLPVVAIHKGHGGEDEEMEDEV